MEFIPNTQALELKELGFNEPCWAWYNIPDEDVRYCYSEGRGPITNIQEEWDAKIDNKPVENIGLPTFSQAFRWFREKYKLYPEIGLHDREDEETWRFTISILGYYELAYNQDISKEAYYKTYEEAELACIKKLIEIIKENGK